MKKRMGPFTVYIMILVAAAGSISYAFNTETESLHDNGGTNLRVGYLESEPFVNYAGMLYSLTESLHELNWIDSMEGINYSENQTDTSKMWQWLSQNDISSRLEFVDNAHFTLSSMGINEQQDFEKKLAENDLDLMIVMGTAAGEFVSDKETNTAFMVYAASNAVQSGIIQSESDSGKDNVWAHMDAKRFQRQISVFHEMFAFHTLGIVHEDSPVARSYSAVEDIEFVAGEKGFNIMASYVDEPISADDQERYYREVKQAYAQLAEEVDAVYITVASLDSKWLPVLLEPFYEKGIPVFSQLGEVEVANGALLSISVNDLKNIGRFGADNIVRFFNGESLRLLPQVFESTPQIIINLEIAERIDYKVPFGVLLSADKVFLKTGE